VDLAVLFVAMLAAAVLGLVAGWLGWGRAAAALRAERDDFREKFGRAITDLAGAEERARQAASLQAALDTARDEREAARIEAQSLKAEAQVRETAFEQRLAELREAKETLSAQFSEIGGKLLAEAQGQFLNRANERFAEAEKESEAKLKLLLQPVETTLKRYEDGLQRVEKERVDTYAGLREAIDQVRVGQGQVREEAAKLVNALRAAPKTRGRWGEQQFKNLIEIAGLSHIVDFRSEVSVETDQGLLRPDFVIRLPGDQQLVVDIKCSLDGYLNAADATDPQARAGFLQDHSRSVRLHAESLAKKSYWDQFDKAPDFVIMYVPGDNFVSAALEADLELWERAARKRIIICGPSTFLPMARTVASIWRQEKLAEEAKAIGALGKEMYDRLAVAVGHLRRVGGGLNSAVENYNKFVSSFEGRVLVSARRFRELNVETGPKEIEAIESVETLAREPMIELPSPAE
jgi:DNA recombination protein RmuC